MIIGISMGLETCQTPGQAPHKPTPQEEKTPDGHTWPGGRLTRKQLTSRPDHLWPELWRGMSKNAKLREKQKWSHEKPQQCSHQLISRPVITNALRLCVGFWVIPEGQLWS